MTWETSLNATLLPVPSGAGPKVTLIPCSPPSLLAQGSQKMRRDTSSQGVEPCPADNPSTSGWCFRFSSEGVRVSDDQASVGVLGVHGACGKTEVRR